MVVRVKVELLNPRTGMKVRTSALVNSAFESGEIPEINVPLPLAGNLGYTLTGAKKIKYEVAGGGQVTTYVLGEIGVKVVVEDRSTSYVKARAVAIEGEEEVILSDKLIQELKIVVVEPASGKWVFRDEPLDRLRESALREVWRK